MVTLCSTNLVMEPSKCPNNAIKGAYDNFRRHDIPVGFGCYQREMLGFFRLLSFFLSSNSVCNHD